MLRRKSYSELMTLPTFEERFQYLQVAQGIGIETFGHDRYLNQILYRCPEWKKARQQIIIRDGGCDLAHPDHPIPPNGRIIVHHINPLTIERVLNRDPEVFDPENLISALFDTHEALHYGSEEYLQRYSMIERQPNDTCPWKR